MKKAEKNEKSRKDREKAEKNEKSRKDREKAEKLSKSRKIVEKQKFSAKSRRGGRSGTNINHPYYILSLVSSSSTRASKICCITTHSILILYSPSHIVLMCWWCLFSDVLLCVFLFPVSLSFFPLTFIFLVDIDFRFH